MLTIHLTPCLNFRTFSGRKYSPPASTCRLLLIEDFWQWLLKIKRLELSSHLKLLKSTGTSVAGAGGLFRFQGFRTNQLFPDIAARECISLKCRISSGQRGQSQRLAKEDIGSSAELVAGSHVYPACSRNNMFH